MQLKLDKLEQKGGRGEHVDIRLCFPKTELKHYPKKQIIEIIFTLYRYQSINLQRQSETIN